MALPFLVNLKTPAQRTFGLYIHVPFCSRKCPYCDFNTYAVSTVPEQEYVSALLREMDIYAASSPFGNKQIHSIFFGGGTPSLLSPDGISRIVRHAHRSFGILPGIEVTLEANPAAAQEAVYSLFKEAGITRISFGAQSFSDEVLAYLGREHTSSQIEEAVRAALAVGVEDISLDIIFGVPNQSQQQLDADIARASALPISHISTYSLTIEKGTPFFQREQRGLLVMPEDDLVAEMMERLPRLLEREGFTRYEISNFARRGKESFHNSAYWKGEDYLGLGAGAHSFILHNDHRYDAATEVNGSRWSNCALPVDYMRRVVDGPADAWREVVDRSMLQFEFFFLGLRIAKGVDLSQYRERFGEEADQRFGAVFSDLLAQGLLLRRDNCVMLSPKGTLLADSVIGQFA